MRPRPRCRGARARCRSEARATEMVSGPLRGNTNARLLRGAEVHRSAEGFRESDNQKVFFMPVEATSVLASIGGIAELAKTPCRSPPRRAEGTRSCTTSAGTDMVALVDRRRGARCVETSSRRAGDLFAAAALLLGAVLLAVRSAGNCSWSCSHPVDHCTMCGGAMSARRAMNPPSRCSTSAPRSTWSRVYRGRAIEGGRGKVLGAIRYGWCRAVTPPRARRCAWWR